MITLEVELCYNAPPVPQCTWRGGVEIESSTVGMFALSWVRLKTRVFLTEWTGLWTRCRKESVVNFT